MAPEEMYMTEPISAVDIRARRALSECDGPLDLIVVVAEGTSAPPGGGECGSARRIFRLVKSGGAA